MVIGVGIFSALIIIAAVVWNLFDEHDSDPNSTSKKKEKHDIK